MTRARSDHAARRVADGRTGWPTARRSTRFRTELIDGDGCRGRVRRQRALSRSRARWTRTSMPDTATRTYAADSFGDAIKEAIAEEMRRDPTVVLMGEDVAEAGTTFKVLTGLVDEFGKDRIIDTPISEAGFTGLGVGAAMTGMRPIVDIMFGDFLTLIMDQVVEPGRQDPLHVRRQVEGADGHSRDDGRDAAVGGAALAVAARVAEPHSRAEGRRALDAVRRQGPVQGGDPRRQPGGHLRAQDQLPEGEGSGAGRGLRDSARRRRREARRHATSRSSRRAAWCRWRSARRRCSRRSGISAEVVDPRTTWPLDEKTLIESVKKTSRCIVMDEGYGRYGVTGEIASVIAQGGVLRSRRPGDGESARCTCRFRSRRRSRTRPCRASAQVFDLRGRCAIGDADGTEALRNATER